jgi:Tfp pilus assembly protein PilV
MIELMIAIVMLLIGVVAVAQLVPNAMQSNFRNRYDSTGLILAQRQLEQMMNPLSLHRRHLFGRRCRRGRTPQRPHRD